MRSQFIYRMMGRLGYDAITLGPREIRFLGTTIPSDDGPPVIMTNVFDTRHDPPVPAADRWKIYDVGGKKIGVFALVSPNTPEVSLADIPWVEIRDPEGAVADAMAHFGAEGVDLTLLLSQMEKLAIDPLLEAHPEIDVVLMGHNTTKYRGPNYEPPFQNLSMYGGMRGQSLSHAVIGFDDDGMSSTSVGFVEVTRDRAPVPELATLVREFETEIDEIKRAERVARQSDDGFGSPHTFTGPTPCKRCHEPEFDAWAASPHAQAFGTLLKLGMSESRDCLSCHTVGLGEYGGYGHKEASVSLGGVQCESCHGQGTNHYNGDMLSNAYETKQLCVSCHDQANSPNFDFDSYLEKIRHW